jgi:uncharacterized protein YbjT (DUF2867 family)
MTCEELGEQWGDRDLGEMLARGCRTRCASRSQDPTFDWNIEATWPRALEGVSSAYITYYPDLALPGAAQQVRSFAQQAVAHGVGQLVLLAGRGEPQVFPAEQAVRESGAQFTILRCAFFAQNFSEGALTPWGDEIAFPAGNVTEPFIDVEDIADIAVAALTDPQRHAGRIYDLTGPRLLSFEMAVEEIARAAGRPLRYVPVSFEDYADVLAQIMPPDHVHFFIGLFRHLLDGHNSQLTRDVELVLGRPPRDFRDYARDAAASGAWSQAVAHQTPISP